MPMQTWEEVDSPELALAVPPNGPARRASAIAQGIQKGEFVLFSHRRVSAGSPPDWHRNQLTGESLPGDVHWSRIGDFNFGDIKGVWELSRFGWAYALVRQGDDPAAKTFWSLWADWMRRNPPNAGPNWMCGQEASIRLMAVVFAAERLGLPAEHGPMFARFVTATAQRVAANLDYALAQQNNHGISECVGLLTAALLVPNHSHAGHWQGIALRRLRAQLAELVYEDGAFSQHSLVYHRVALHQLCWVATRLRAAGQDEPDWLIRAGRRLTDFLAAITDPETGEAPLYGANDGADVLPLSDSDFLDLRPAVQLGAAIFHRTLRYAAGPWDEPACWLVGGAENLPRRPQALADYHAPAGGMLQLGTTGDRLTLRCPVGFRHRPSQADFGHVDVWLGGRRIAIDGGSFSYNSRERFTALGSAREHNGITFEGLEPMRKVTRFLYLPWPKGDVRSGVSGEWTYQPQLYEAAGIGWRRSVARWAGGGFVVTDTITGSDRHLGRLHWLLADLPYAFDADGSRLILRTPAGDYAVSWSVPAGNVSLVSADGDSARGWWSPHYAHAKPALSLAVEFEFSGECRIETRFGPA